MPSIARAILLALHASSFLALTGFSPATISALASPVPNPSIAVRVNSPSSLLAARVLSKLSDAGLARSHDTDTTPALQQRQSTSEPLSSLYEYSQESQKKSDAMKDLAARSRSIRPSDYEAFRRECVTAFTSYQEHFARFPRLLGPLSADAGLANYDKTDQLETLLKDIVNANKDALSATYVLVDNIPGLGPVLGPIVYVVKCIVDELLDATENLTDAIINILKPLIAPLLDPILCGPLGLGLLCL